VLPTALSTIPKRRARFGIGGRSCAWDTIEPAKQQKARAICARRSMPIVHARCSAAGRIRARRPERDLINGERDRVPVNSRWGLKGGRTRRAADDGWVRPPSFPCIVSTKNPLRPWWRIAKRTLDLMGLLRSSISRRVLGHDGLPQALQEADRTSRRVCTFGWNSLRPALHEKTCARPVAPRRQRNG